MFAASKTSAAAGAPPGPVTDPQFNYVTMLLHGDGTNGAQNNTFVSEPVVAPSGVGYLAGQFSGSGQWLSTPTNTALDFGTGDFTIEGWVWLDSTVNPGRPDNLKTVTLFSTGSGSANDCSFAIYGNTSVAGVGLELYQASPAIAISAAATVPTNSWAHIAFVRSGTTIYGFVNGVRSTLGTTSSAIGSGVAPKVGAANTTSYTNQFKGYLSNLRVVKGTAVYTSNFSVPTSPLTAISGTSLLTCQSGSGATFADNSTNNFTITRTGTPTMVGVATMPGGLYTGFFSTTSSAVYIATPMVITTTPFTVEAWVYPTAYTSNANDGTIIVSTRAWSFGNNRGWWWRFNTTGNLVLSASQGVWNNFPAILTSARTIPLNQWTHIACVRDSGGVVKMYINGAVDTNSVTYSSSMDQIGTNGGGQGTYQTGIGNQFADGAWQTNSTFAGYINNVRVSTSTAFYTANFAPPATALTAITGTNFLTCQSATFIDNSLNAYSVLTNSTPSMTTVNALLPTITRNGTPTQGSFSPYGPLWSNYFIGSGQYLTYSPSTSLAFGTGNFTVEAWVYSTETASGSGTTTASQYIIDSRTAAVTNSWVFGFRLFGSGTGNLVGWYTGATLIEGTAAPVNQWNHVAYCRSGTTGYLFLNGALVTTTTDSKNYSSTGATATIGSRYSVENFLFGYLSNLRIINGTALYTSAFTPSTTPLTAVSGTSLLTCQSNRFRDNSSNNFAITVTGTPSVQRFSPFDPAAEYSTSVIGGSGYFGSTATDFLTVPSSTATNLTNSNFTFESWFYKVSNPSSETNLIWWNGNSNSSSYAGLRVQLNNNGTLSLLCSESGSAWQISSTSTASYSNSVWNHVAAVRNGQTVTLYLNGVSVASGSLSSSTASLFAGTLNYINNMLFSSGTWKMVGYFSNLRLVVGTAVYTAAFTPPTAPLTAITNTSLLLNTVNAGIFDNAMMNDLVTVGDAKVSTAVKKYGTGSMYFDGSGDTLSLPSSPNIELGSGNFTIELWVNFISAPSSPIEYQLWQPQNHASGFKRLQFYIYQNQIAIAYFGTNVALSAALTWNTGQWYHLAVVRNGSSWTIYRDGSSIATGTNTQTLDAASGYSIGASINGYMDEYRITKGVARYTANFTPPTAAFPNN